MFKQKTVKRGCHYLIIFWALCVYVENETTLVIVYDKDRFVVHRKYVLKGKRNFSCDLLIDICYLINNVFHGCSIVSETLIFPSNLVCSGISTSNTPSVLRISFTNGFLAPPLRTSTMGKMKVG